MTDYLDHGPTDELTTVGEAQRRRPGDQPMTFHYEFVVVPEEHAEHVREQQTKALLDISRWCAEHRETEPGRVEA